MKRHMRVPWYGLSLVASLGFAASVTLAQQDPALVFAVVTKISKDHKQVTAQVLDGTAVSEATLIPSDAILDNPIWKKLEICHSLKLEAWKQPEGYRIASVRGLDAGMLPMPLQGLAGDCLLRKALEVAPLVD